jgi:hypothetical protein
MRVHTQREFVGVVNAVVLPHLVEEQEDIFVSVNDPSNAAQMLADANMFFNIVVTFVSGNPSQGGNAFQVTLPEWAEAWLDFEKLAAEWKKNRTRWRSFAGDLTRDISYQRIVAMGPEAVRFILWEIKAELLSGNTPDDWFYALWLITKENPVPESAQGDLVEAGRAWLEWGERKGIIDAELGIRVSASW